MQAGSGGVNCLTRSAVLPTALEQGYFRKVASRLFYVSIKASGRTIWPGSLLQQIVELHMAPT